MELKTKEIEILEFLEKENKEVYQTRIAFVIKANPYYIKDYLENLERLGLVEKSKINFGRAIYTAWKIKKQVGKNKLPSLTTKNG